MVNLLRYRRVNMAKHELWELQQMQSLPLKAKVQMTITRIRAWVEIFTDEGDVVIDPCCGSGSTLRAAKELNRSAYGFEIDRNFYQRAKDEMLNFEPDNQMSITDFM